MRNDDSGSDDLAKDMEKKADEYEVKYVLRDGKLVRETVEPGVGTPPDA